MWFRRTVASTSNFCVRLPLSISQTHSVPLFCKHTRLLPLPKINTHSLRLFPLYKLTLQMSSVFIFLYQRPHSVTFYASTPSFKTISFPFLFVFFTHKNKHVLANSHTHISPAQMRLNHTCDMARISRTVRCFSVSHEHAWYYTKYK